MAYDTATSSGTLQAYLLEHKTKEVVDQFQTDVLLYQLFTKEKRVKTEIAGGEQITVPVKIPAFPGIKNPADAGTIAASRALNTADTYTTMKNTQGTIDFLIKHVEQMKTDSLADLADTKMEDLKAWFKWYCAIQWYGNGYGALAQADQAVSGSTQRMADVRHIREGMVMDSYAAETGGSATADSVVVTAVNFETRVVTFTGTISGCGAADYWYLEDSRGTVMQGLKSLIGTTDNTVQNINRGTAANYYFVPVVKAADAEGLTEKLLAESNHLVKLRGGEGPIKYCIVDPVGCWQLAARLKGLALKASDIELEGGYSGIEFAYLGNKFQILADELITPGCAYGINPKTLKIFHTGLPHFSALGGSIWKWTANYMAYLAFMVYFAELTVSCPASNFTITGLPSKWASIE